MAFQQTVDTVKEKMEKIAGATARKSKELAALARLHFKISMEEGRMRRAYKEIGERYYANYGKNPFEEFSNLCLQIQASVAKIEENKAKIAFIRAAARSGREAVDFTYITEEEPIAHPHKAESLPFA